MGETLEIPFSDRDAEDLDAFRELVNSPGPFTQEDAEIFTAPEETFTFEDESPPTSQKSDRPRMDRQTVTLPQIEASTDKTRAAVEEALETGARTPKGSSVKLPSDLIESVKAAFTSTGGNISKVAAMYDLTPEAVMRLAAQEEWAVYEGSNDALDSASKGQLQSLKDRLWKRIEHFLDSIEVEEKQKYDIVQYRTESRYVEPLAARNSTFKVLMDQYMRVGAILEPELYGADPDGANYNARRAREEQYPGGIEGVNREMADFLSQVVVGIHDRIQGREKEMEGYGQIIDARAQNE